jgi:YbbR domain-containing protein
MAVIDKLIKSKTFYIVISCIASVILWMYVASYENTTQSVTLTGLEVKYIGGEDILQDRNLLVTDKDMQDVTLTLLVKRSLVSQLTKDTVHVSVDLRDIRNSGEFDKIYTITYDNVDEEDVIVTRRVPEYMKVNIERMDVNPEVVVKGVFDGTVADGYMREPIVYSPETIEVSGPESVISRIAYAKVVIDRENLTRTVSGVVEFTLVDKDGQIVESSEITTSVDEIEYMIPIVKVKDVGLTVNLLSGGGATEDNAVVRIEPSTITLSGDAELLNSINQLQLGTIDLASFAQSTTETFAIVLPNGVNNLSGEKEATVTVSIKGLETKRVITTNITFINVSEGYRPRAITQYKEVTIRGPKEIIDLIDKNNIRIVGDLTDIGNAVGRYSVPTTVEILGYREAGVIGDNYNVVVSLELDVPDEEEGEEGTEEP